MAQDKPQEREQDNAIDEQHEVARAFQVELHRWDELGAHHRCGEVLRGGVGMREEE
jgi:hypothetical protein